MARAIEKLSGEHAADTHGLRALAEFVRAQREYLDRFVVRARGKYHFVPVDDVHWIEGAQNYLVLHAGARSHMVRGTLTAAEARLDPSRFVRVHRSAIVNTLFIESVEPRGHGEFVLKLPDGARVKTSRSYSRTVRGLVEGLLGPS